jgi:hypothetical protein
MRPEVGFLEDHKRKLRSFEVLDIPAARFMIPNQVLRGVIGMA